MGFIGGVFIALICFGLALIFALYFQPAQR
jgi:hypothetical protein